MNDLIVIAFGGILLLAVLPMFLMGRAFKGAGKREADRGDASSGIGADNRDMWDKSAVRPDDSGGDGGVDGGDGGGGGD
ncbi:MAG TPA: hypothetical protein PLH23_08915 [Hyphomonadaceae bacterium]|nr:hypothetical protein [Hyphomonadaceae bacterium]HPI48375.1 hypothetical protein [Hyphomonadaceae bacterium]